MYHQIQETYEERLTTGTMTGSRDFGNKPRSSSASNKQITLVMVMDPDSCSPNASLRKVQLGTKVEETRYKTLTNFETKNSDLEKILSLWILQFLKFMSSADAGSNLLQGHPRFSEIRPI